MKLTRLGNHLAYQHLGQFHNALEWKRGSRIMVWDNCASTNIITFKVFINLTSMSNRFFIFHLDRNTTHFLLGNPFNSTIVAKKKKNALGEKIKTKFCLPSFKILKLFIKRLNTLNSEYRLMGCLGLAWIITIVLHRLRLYAIAIYASLYSAL